MFFFVITFFIKTMVFSCFYRIYTNALLSSSRNMDEELFSMDPDLDVHLAFKYFTLLRDMESDVDV